MKKVLTGNHAVSWGVKLARAQVIAAYPITPQTQVVEALAEMCASGELDARYISVESEHSALAACVGASAAGVRAFTASSAQGLAYMHEVLHWAGAGRLPVVMANVNRALAPPWNVWADQSDSLSQRDTGWIQLYCESTQEVLDSTVLAFKLAESIQLPAMVVLDAFYLSHTAEPVDIPDQAQVDEFLPRYEAPRQLDVEEPRSYGSLMRPAAYMAVRARQQTAMSEVPALLSSLEDEWAAMTGRRYGAIEEYRTEDADLLLVTSGTITSTARVVIDRRREAGEKVGLVKVKLFRPFPTQRLREALSGAERVAVLDRNLSPGRGGIFAEEIRAALYDLPEARRPLLYGYVLGLGGGDITPEIIDNIIERSLATEPPAEEYIWLEEDS